MGFSDAELVVRVVADDDRHAFAELVRRHQSLVRSLLRRLTAGDEAWADDLAQETFLRAYRGLQRYRGGSKFSTWLYRIAYNVFLSSRSRAPESMAGDPVGRTSVSAGDALLQHDLEQAMMTLSPAERAAITLAYREEASHGEIAEILDCPLGTVKTHIARAKEKLARRMRAWA